MPVNFDSLPQKNPFERMVIAPGLYRALIEKAEMKAPKNGGTMYLDLTLALTDKDGKTVGKFWDKQFDSDKPLLQFKLARFITACGFPLSGQMELSDLGKLVVGKTITIDICNKPDQKDPTKINAEVDLFTHEVYYKETEFDAIYAIINQLTPAPDASSFIDAGVQDGADEVPFNEDKAAEQTATNSEY